MFDANMAEQVKKTLKYFNYKLLKTIILSLMWSIQPTDYI